MNENLKRKVEKVLDTLFKFIMIVGAIPMLLCIGLIVNCSGNYFIQKKYMTHKLNKIPNVEVINIWGHEDFDLEEISARMMVNDTNEIVLNYLSCDVFNYPYKVYISELNGRKFIPFFKDSYGCYLDIGTESIIGKELGLVFNTPEDVINNIDKLDDFFKKLDTAPKLNYFCDTVLKKEMYIGIVNKKGNDTDPINVLFDYERKLDFTKQLDWKY